jgi:hypothetical protein
MGEAMNAAAPERLAAPAGNAKVLGRSPVELYRQPGLELEEYRPAMCPPMSPLRYRPTASKPLRTAGSRGFGTQSQAHSAQEISS